MTFYEVGDFDEFFRQLHEKERDWISWAPAKQRQLSWGSYAMMPADEGVMIFGYVMTPEELNQSEIECGATEEEAEFSLRSIREALERGYLFGRWYSVWEPDGELGSNHASRCWPITGEQFKQAKEHDWEPKEIIDSGGKWLVDRYVELGKALGAL